MYFQLQRLVTLVRDAATPAPFGFDREPRLRHELRRVLADIPDEEIPAELADALTTGVVVGPDAARWLPSVKAWLVAECRQTGD